jgi:hypothetical protein
MGQPRQAIDDIASPFSLPFGQTADGHIEAPADSNGICRCPACKRPLGRYTKDLLSIPHFVHPPTTDCDNAFEVTLALKALQVLESSHQLSLPAWHRASLDRQDHRGKVHFFDYRIEPTTWGYTRTALAEPYPGFRADAVLHNDGAAVDSDSLVIELKVQRGDNIAKTNLGALRELGVRSLELDISAVKAGDLTSSNFADFVSHHAPRAWLYFPQAEQDFERLTDALNERFEAAMQPAESPNS